MLDFKTAMFFTSNAENPTEIFVLLVENAVLLLESFHFTLGFLDFDEFLLMAPPLLLKLHPQVPRFILILPQDFKLHPSGLQI